MTSFCHFLGGEPAGVLRGGKTGMIFEYPVEGTGAVKAAGKSELGYGGAGSGSQQTAGMAAGSTR